MSGRHFVGVTANNVTRVVLIGSRGGRHSVPVTEDGGFIHNCRAYNGCASLIVCVQSYNRSNKLLGSEPVMGGFSPLNLTALNLVGRVGQRSGTTPEDDYHCGVRRRKVQRERAVVRAFDELLRLRS